MSEPIRIDAHELERLAASGANVRELAAALGVSKATLLKYKASDERLARAYRRGRLKYARETDKAVVKRKGRLVLVRADHAQGGLVQTPAALIMNEVDRKGQVSWNELLKLTRLNDNGLGLVILDMIRCGDIEPLACDFNDRTYVKVKGRKVA